MKLLTQSNLQLCSRYYCGFSVERNEQQGLSGMLEPKNLPGSYVNLSETPSIPCRQVLNTVEKSNLATDPEVEKRFLMMFSRTLGLREQYPESLPACV